MKMKCGLCEKTFAKQEYLSKHSKISHGVNYCGVCNTTHNEEKEIHALKHKLGKRFLCPECGKSFNRKQKVYDHAYKVHSLQLGNQNCPIAECKRAFQDKKALNMHLASHTNSGRTDLVRSAKNKCDFCGDNFQSPDGLEDHQRICTEGVAFERNLNEKFHVNPSKVKRVFTCLNLTKCAFQTGNLTVLRKHVLTHNEWEIAQCSDCRTYFCVISQFNSHSCTPVLERVRGQINERSLFDVIVDNFMAENKFSVSEIDGLIDVYPFGFVPKHLFMVKMVLILDQGVMYLSKLKDFSLLCQGRAVTLARVPDFSELFSLEQFNLCSGDGLNPCHGTACDCKDIGYRLKVRRSNFKKNFKKNEFDLGFFGELGMYCFQEKVLKKVALIEQDFSCKTCVITFTSFEEFSSHAKSHNEIPEGFECDICETRFIKAHHLRPHMRKHDSKTFPCLICSMKFGSKTDVKCHQTMAHGKALYKCNLCKKIFYKKKSLSDHKRKMHVEHLEYKCGVCEKPFDVRKTLVNHVKSVHLKAKLKCPDCDKSFLTVPGLDRHRRVHKIVSNQGKKFKCDQCNKWFCRKDGLTRHVSEKHINPKPKKSGRNVGAFKCEQCGLSYSKKGSLDRHVRETHSVQNPRSEKAGQIECDQCGMLFHFKLLLNAHKKEMHKA